MLLNMHWELSLSRLKMNLFSFKIISMTPIIYLILLKTENPILKKADSLFTSFEFKRAMVLYEEALQKSNSKQEKEKIISKIIDIAYFTGNYNLAINYLKILDKLIEKEKKYFIFYKLGLIFENLGEIDSALNYFQKILAEERDSVLKEIAGKEVDKIFEKKLKEYIAEAGNIKLTKLEYENYVNSLPPFKKPKNKEEEKKVIKDLLFKKIILIESLKEGFLWDYEYNKELTNLKEENLIKLYFKKIADTIKIKEEEIKDYYNKHKDKFEKEDKTFDEAKSYIEKVLRMEKFKEKKNRIEDALLKKYNTIIYGK